MKKLLLFFSLLLSLLPLSLPAAAETQTITETIIFSDIWGTTSGPNTITEEYATITFAKNDATTACAYNVSSDKCVRLYKPSSGKTNGGGITITPSKNTFTITGAKLVKSDNSETDFTDNQDGSFVFINKTSTTIKVKSLKISYEAAKITTPAGMPEVTINGIAIDEGCFYNISKDSKAEVSAADATSISILYNNGDGLEEITGNKGSFDITTSGEYIIESTNGEYDGETLSFNVNIIDPEKTITYTDVWEKVLSTDEITDDGEYIIVCESKNDVASNESKDDNKKVLPVTIIDSKIKSLLAEDAEKHPLIINIKKEGESNYYLTATNYLGDTSKGNYLTSVNGSSNSLNIGAKSGTYDNALTTISISPSGDATISFVNCKDKSGNNVRTIRHNSSSDLYATYGTSQIAVQLYKKGEPEQNETLKYSTKEYLDLPDFEHDVTAKKITFTCSNTKVLFEERHYDAAASQNYAPKAVADGWNAMADGVFDHSAFTNDIILETRAYREDAAGNRVVESPIHAMRVNASGTVTGIESVAAEAEGEGELYNLQGVRVNRATAAPGLYIERRAGKAVKVIL